MKFYHKNFDDLIKEGYLNKFDNVTYKTIKHEHKIDPGDMEKFLLNFDMMTSRPNKAGPLPSFMQKMYTRESAYCMTEKSLKENNFSNAKFMSATTSFFPKRSYNKIINLNLLNGEVQMEFTYNYLVLCGCIWSNLIVS